MIRRVVMCCLSSGGSGKRQHLAVAHEKGKITMLQLSALLKQADSSQKKLTLTRLSSAPVPFTVLSVVSNPCNEDYLAVTGLKDCHVLAFNSNGSVADHLVLHPQLDSHNYIVKAVWLAGSQTEIAIVTADFVKIYDLSKDVLSPQFYFIVPSGKIRDCTLAFTEEGKFVIIMSSAGHIYFQALTSDSSAVSGPFYVTNIMTVSDPNIHDATEQVFKSIIIKHFQLAPGIDDQKPISKWSNYLTLKQCTLTGLNQSCYLQHLFRVLFDITQAQYI